MTVGHTENGGLFVPAELCAKVSAALGVVLELQRSSGAGVDREVARLAADAAEAFRLGESVQVGKPEGAPVIEWLTAREAAARLGISRQEMTDRCRGGEVPGAVQQSNRQWRIPADAVPEEIDGSHHDDAEPAERTSRAS